MKEIWDEVHRERSVWASIASDSSRVLAWTTVDGSQLLLTRLSEYFIKDAPEKIIDTDGSV